MAWYRAISTGVASDLARWEVSTDNGSSWTAASVLPTAADDVYPNGYTVTLDYDIVADKLINRTALGIVAGGSFPIGAATTITADIYAGSASCVTFGSTGTKNIVGDLFGTTTAGLTGAVDNTSTGQINIVGNCTGGSTTNSAAMLNRVTGSINIVGTCFAGTGTNAAGLWNGLISGSGGLCTISAAVTTTSSIAIITENNITITTVTSSTTQPAISPGNAAFITVTNAICTNGVMICSNMTRIRMVDAGQFQFPLASGGLGVFGSLISQGQASPADVRLGTSYANGALTGTCAVPPAGSVSLGVPVDATTGTGSVTSAEIRDLILPSILSAITAP